MTDREERCGNRQGLLGLCFESLRKQAAVQQSLGVPDTSVIFLSANQLKGTKGRFDILRLSINNSQGFCTTEDIYFDITLTLYDNKFALPEECSNGFSITVHVFVLKPSECPTPFYIPIHRITHDSADDSKTVLPSDL